MAAILPLRLVLVWLCSGIALPAQTAAPPADSQPFADASYLKGLPDTNRVFADIRGTNSADTVARQRGAFVQLIVILRNLTVNESGRKTNKSEGAALFASYVSARDQIAWPAFDEAETRRLGMESPRAKWVGLMYHYETDPVLEKELVGRYLTADWQAKYAVIQAAREAQNAEIDRRNKLTLLQQKQELALWDRTNRIDRLFPIVIGAGIVIFLLVYILALMIAFGGRLELDPKDPRKLYRGKTEYVISSTAGTVIQPEKQNVTFQSVSGGYNDVPVSRVTRTITYLDFVLKSASGAQLPFHVTTNLANSILRDGHTLSVVWAVERGQTSKMCFMFRNLSTGQTEYEHSTFSRMIRFSWLRKFPAAFLSWGCFFPIGVLLYYILKRSAMKKRMTRIKSQIAENLIPELDRADRLLIQ